MTRRADALQPAPTRGAVLTVYTPGFCGNASSEKHHGLRRVERVTPAGQLVIGGNRYDPRDAALLIAIQETFARLYTAAHPALAA